MAQHASTCTTGPAARLDVHDHAMANTLQCCDTYSACMQAALRSTNRTGHRSCTLPCRLRCVQPTAPAACRAVRPREDRGQLHSGPGGPRGRTCILTGGVAELAPCTHVGPLYHECSDPSIDRGGSSSIRARARENAPFSSPGTPPPSHPARQVFAQIFLIFVQNLPNRDVTSPQFVLVTLSDGHLDHVDLITGRR